MRLRLTGEVAVACTRCLKPVRVRLDEERLFKLALTESQAERETHRPTTTTCWPAVRGSTSWNWSRTRRSWRCRSRRGTKRCSLPGAGGGAQRASAGDDEGDAQEPVRENPFAVLHKLKRRDGGREGG